ncbi:MAG: alanine--tRNA ligase [bacterium]
MITAKELRQKYIDFFKEKGHKAIPSASLIPENDPTVLFTTAGMHPLVPYLLGQPHPEGKRIVDAQKCVRTGDIEDVGDNRHLTFFEMLGNWSFGDYFKEDAIQWSWEFLTGKKWLGLDPKRLYITVFKGDGEIPRDDEVVKIWQDQFKKFGIFAGVANDNAVWGSEDVRIFVLPKKDNFWEMGGENGPCGPCTEIFYDVFPEKGWENKNFDELTCEFRFIEIWNNVFMLYNKAGAGTYEPLLQKNVDTGMGVERTVAILNGAKNVFETELFAPIIKRIKGMENPPQSPFAKGENEGDSFLTSSLSREREEENLPASFAKGETEHPLQLPLREGERKKECLLPEEERRKGEVEKSERIIADHIKAAVMILADDKKIVPSNVERGYVLRRLIRRAVRYGKILGIEGNFMAQIAEAVVDMYKETYLEVGKNKDFIFRELEKEEDKFGKTLGRGLIMLEKTVKELDKNTMAAFKKHGEKVYEPKISGKIVFDLYQTYGFPPELTEEELAEYTWTYDKEEFQQELKKHQDLSRTASAGMFKSGLADNSEATTKLHTATHLLQAALREILGVKVEQRGSNITPERLRFDFSHFEKMSSSQIKQAENWVNDKIQKNLAVICEEMSPEKAKESGALGLFDAKYGNLVTVFTIKDGEKIISREICKGPHIEETGVLGKFKIVKEEASSQGVRRIKAVLE